MAWQLYSDSIAVFLQDDNEQFYSNEFFSICKLFCLF